MREPEGLETQFDTLITESKELHKLEIQRYRGEAVKACSCHSS